MEIGVSRHVMLLNLTTLLEALDAASNLGTEGCTGYPGEREIIATIKL